MKKRLQKTFGALSRRACTHRLLVITLLLIALIPAAGCWKQLPPVNGIELQKLDAGDWWHDIHFINKSGKDLHEVKLTLTIVGEDGDPSSEDRYYALWSDGQTVNISLSIENSPLNVQKISLSGSCSEGEIASSWIP